MYEVLYDLDIPTEKVETLIRIGIRKRSYLDELQLSLF